MGGIEIYPHSKHTPALFILTCLRAIFKEQLIHDRWIPADQLCIHMHMKFNIADEIQFSQGAMIKVVNKMLPFVSMEPNIIEDTDGIELKVYRHSFQVKKRLSFSGSSEWMTPHHQ
jgi:hypothetical protein